MDVMEWEPILHSMFLIVIILDLSMIDLLAELAIDIKFFFEDCERVSLRLMGT